jgi:butyryl-CoA dehydrogenase
MSFHFAPSEIQSEIAAIARRFAREKILPTVEADEEEGRFRTETIQGLGDLGLTGIPSPEAYGGAGLGYLEYTAALEEIATVSASYAISVAVTGLPQIILSQFGSEAQKQKYIPLLASGRGVGAFSLSEASSGSDAGSLRATATRNGDEYILNGTKLWCTQGDSADVLMIMARTGGPGPKGISTFIVEKGMPGLKMGKREKKMGCHISHTMELVLENLRIPAENRVGDEGIGFKIAMSALDSGRITIASTAIGVARAALEVAISHAKLREQFGKPIAEFQGIGFMLADMATEIESARLLVQKAAWLKDNGLPFAQLASMAKLKATDVAMEVTTDAVQILGGSGYTQDFPVERYMREAKLLQIVEGTNQVQRLIIGRSLSQPS